jgi:hypothetical protein
MTTSRFAAAAWLVLLGATPLSAQQPTTQITRAQGGIRIDGVLDDA